MTNINLFESAQGGSSQRNTSRSNKAFIIPVVILVGAFLILGGAKLYSAYLTKKKVSIDAQNASEMATLSGKTVDRIIDFKVRLRKIDKEMSDKNNFVARLKDLESSMVSGARLTTFNDEVSKINLSVTSDTLQTLARQTVSFKNSTYFKDMAITSATRNEAGEVTAPMSK